MRSRVDGFVAHSHYRSVFTFVPTVGIPCWLSETSHMVAEPELFSCVGQCAPDAHDVNNSSVSRVCYEPHWATIFSCAAYELTLVKTDALWPCIVTEAGDTRVTKKRTPFPQRAGRDCYALKKKKSRNKSSAYQG